MLKVDIFETLELFDLNDLIEASDFIMIIIRDKITKNTRNSKEIKAATANRKSRSLFDEDCRGK